MTSFKLGVGVCALGALGLFGCSSGATNDGGVGASQHVEQGCRALSFSAAGSQSAVAVGDYDGDGRADVAVAGASNASLTIAFQGSDGFTKRESLDGQGVPFAALATMGSGKRATLLSGSDNRVLTLSGLAPDATDVTQTDYFAGDVVTSIAVGDVDGDGHADVVAGSAGLPGIGVLLGKAGGGFAEKKTFPSPTDGVSVTLADLDGDGALDVVLANPTMGGITTMRNDGHGTFERGVIVHTQLQGTPVGLIAADVTGDGVVDVVVANRAGSVSLLAGDGQGGFAPHRDLAVAGEPVGIGTVDSSAGKVIVVATRGGRASYGTLAPDGNGGFRPWAAARQNLGPSASMAIADVDGDGSADLVLGADGDDGEQAAHVLLGNGDGTFGASGSSCAAE